MTATTTTLDARVSAFAEAVRARLDDLTDEEIDDLTDGLEADLSEQARDEGDLTTDDPQQYADELRASAGLPERSAATPATLPWRERLEIGRVWVAGWVRSTRVGAELADFVVALRPVWWVLRGWIWYLVVVFVTGQRIIPFPRDGFGWVLLIALAIVSVQWGRGRWASGQFWTVMRRSASVIAVLSLPLAVIVIESDRGDSVSGQATSEYYPQPVSSPGPDSDFQAFDVNGVPLSGTQLFDRDGNVIYTVQPQIPTPSASGAIEPSPSASPSPSTTPAG